MPISQWSTKKIILHVMIVSVVLLMMTIAVVYYNYQAVAYHAMLPSGAKPLVFEVKPATTARQLVKQLYSQHLIRSRSVLVAVIRLSGASQHLQQGVYQIDPGDTALAFIHKVINGQVIVESFRIEEGSNLFELNNKLLTAPYLHSQPNDFNAFAKQYPSAEGLFLAETYTYKAGSQAASMLKQANQNLQRYLEAAWQNRDENLPYKTAYELLIAASIIEKEAASPDERHLISGVIVKRIRLKMPLQMDPTVIYALIKNGTWSKSLHHHDLSIQSPYNTYRYRGLPPTPIAMVGRESIDAAAHPVHTDYLYFYAKGDGQHQFSKTYQEQQKAIQHYKPKATKP